jgi:hypothetical protein
VTAFVELLGTAALYLTANSHYFNSFDELVELAEA